MLFLNLPNLTFFFSPPGEKKEPKRELVARFDVEEISTLSTVLRDSLRSDRSSHHLKVPCLVVAFLSYISRYRNLVRSKVEGAPHLPHSR